MIKWSCSNSLKDNYSMLLPNAKLALAHYNTIITNQPHIQTFSTELSDMYLRGISNEHIYKLYEVALSKVSP